MTSNEQILAAEWVLGTLSGDDYRDAAHRLATDPAFAAAVAQWESRLHALDDGAEAAPTEGLWRRVAGAVGDTASAPGTQTVRSGDGAWEQLGAGLERRVLFVDRAGGTQSYYIRMKAGARLPQHRHRLTEQCVVLRGELRVGDLTVGAGDFQIGLADQQHLAITAVTDALIFIHGEL